MRLQNHGRHMDEHRRPSASDATPRSTSSDAAPDVELVDFDPDAEVKLIASMLYPHTSRSECDIERRVATMTTDERLAVLRAYTGARSNRRDKPGRALERPFYRFDVLADYGAFRDLQRHRLLTIEWQDLTPRHGFTIPDAVDAAGERDEFIDAMYRSADLHDAMLEVAPDHAAYAVALAYRIRFVMQMNAREAMHLLELRTSPQGHPSYRAVAQKMHTLIGERAGHQAIAAMMQYVDHGSEPTLGRLEAERRAEHKRIISGV